VLKSVLLREIWRPLWPVPVLASPRRAFTPLGLRVHTRYSGVLDNRQFHCHSKTQRRKRPRGEANPAPAIAAAEISRSNTLLSTEIHLHHSGHNCVKTIVECCYRLPTNLPWLTQAVSG